MATAGSSFYSTIWLENIARLSMSGTPYDASPWGTVGSDAVAGGEMGFYDWRPPEGIMTAHALQDSVPVTTPPDTTDPPFPPVWPYPSGLIYGREYWSMNLRMVRGDSYKLDVTVMQDGAAVDLTNFTPRLTAKWAYTDSDANKVFSCTEGDGILITNALAGQLQILIAPAKTSSLPAFPVQVVYDLQISNGVDVFTVLKGKMTISPDATITAP
jgi:hypothetical protein